MSREGTALRRSEPSERFLDKISPEPNSGCWLWTACVDRHGYGRFAQGQAHRFSYEAHVGPIPPGLQTDHLCRVRCCVNPAHLELVTSAENTRRGLNYCSLKTHCPQGHEYNYSNTYRRADGSRSCRACDLIRYHERKREAANG